jgi:hypothetical protein
MRGAQTFLGHEFAGAVLGDCFELPAWRRISQPQPKIPFDDLAEGHLAE